MEQELSFLRKSAHIVLGTWGKRVSLCHEFSESHILSCVRGKCIRLCTPLTQWRWLQSQGQWCHWYPVSESENGCFRGCPNISKLLPKHKAFSFFFPPQTCWCLTLGSLPYFTRWLPEIWVTTVLKWEWRGDLSSHVCHPSPNCPIKNGPDIWHKDQKGSCMVDAEEDTKRTGSWQPLHLQPKPCDVLQWTPQNNAHRVKQVWLEKRLTGQSACCTNMRT